MSRKVEAHDLGTHQPLSEVGPTRSETTGAREDGRGLSSVEQEQDALRWMLAETIKLETAPKRVQARILWALRKPTTLVVDIAYETTPANGKIATAAAVEERDDAGVKVDRSALSIVEGLRAEAPRLGRRG